MGSRNDVRVDKGKIGAANKTGSCLLLLPEELGGPKLALFLVPGNQKRLYRRSDLSDTTIGGNKTGKKKEGSREK